MYVKFQHCIKINIFLISAILLILLQVLNATWLDFDQQSEGGESPKVTLLTSDSNKVEFKVQLKGAWLESREEGENYTLLSFPDYPDYLDKTGEPKLPMISEKFTFLAIKKF